jgi:hypothetical protein
MGDQGLILTPLRWRRRGLVKIRYEMHQESSKVYIDRGVSIDVYVDSIDVCRAVDLGRTVDIVC